MNRIQRAESFERGTQKCDLPWFALQVRTRHEIGVASFLEAKGYEQFVPLYKCRRRWSDRIKVMEAPLFPGYLFCRFDPQYRLPILKTPGVMQIVGYNRNPTPIEENEINAIQTLIVSGLPTQPWPFLTVGERVRIESGPLSGLDGIVVKLKQNHRLVVSVTLLRRSVAVEIDSALVEPFCASPVPQDKSRTEFAQPGVANLLMPARPA
ncbi:MAG TPA: UpxY family transcription antiterminator [Candidatus Acidoferrales bacterium]|jgi:transcription antitermination factor NusG|nr:UpxY family transcription antiterminator [Candidatus Acidoferrales bacterium]